MARNKKLKKHGQGKRSHSKSGIYACILAFLSLSVLGGITALAFVYRGDAASYIGGLGVVAIALGILGLRFSLRGLKEKDKKTLFSKLGIALNGIVLLLFFFIYLEGF